MSTALMSASYAPDFDRCRAMCESVDEHMKGDWHHYLLVDSEDVQRFRQLAGERRTVIDQRELLPWWLRAVPDPFRPGRKLWLRPFGRPLRGWHIQQLMKLAFCRQISEPAMIAIDSDVMLVRDYDPARLWNDGRMRLYSKTGEIDETIRSDHISWLAHSDRLLGIGPYRLPANGYIDSMVSWRTDTARSLLAHIEARNGCQWQRAVTQSRAFSEYIIYGRYVEEVLNGAGHEPVEDPFCHVVWFDDIYTHDMDGLRRFVGDLGPKQIGIGIQSFIGYDLDDIRSALREVSS